jgi:flagellar FliJ protein
MEEQGARDALIHAFEELKKVEHVAETARVAASKEAARRETAALDEMAQRGRRKA